MYAQLGTIRFEGAKGFTSFEESFAVVYAQHALINRKPRLQATGDELDTISFEMYLHSEFTDPEADIETLRLAMKNREILPLILGNGRVLGNYVIPSFKKTTGFTDPSGNLIEATISVELLESYSDNPILDANRQAQNNAFATSTRNSNVRSVLPAKLSPGMAVTANVSKIETSGVLVQQYTATVEQNPAAAELYSDKIDDVMDEINEGLNKIEEAINNGGSLSSYQSPELVNSMADIYTSVQSIKSVLPITDIESFKILVAQLRNSTGAIKKANTDLSNQTIIRRV